MSESRSKKTAQNAVFGFIYQGVSLLLSFVSRTVFIWALGTEYLGLNSIFSDVLKLLSMADLGFAVAMSYSFYKPLAEHDEKTLASLVNFFKKIYNTIAVAVTVAGIACIPFLKYIINTDKEIPHLVLYYLFSLAGVVLSYLFVYKTTLLTADQKDYKVVQVRTWTTLFKTVFQIIVLVIWKNYILYLAIDLLLQFINNFVASRKAEKEYPFIRQKENIQVIDPELKNKIFTNMKSVFVYKLSIMLYTATDNILISMLIGTAIVGIYSNYLMLSSKLLLFEQIIFAAMTASIGNVIVTENEQKRLKIFETMQSASSIFCGIISSVFCLLANDVIHVWLGAQYEVSYIVVIAITINTYFSCILQPLWIYRDATGLYRKTKYIMLTGALMNIFLSIVLGKWIGLAGIIFASAISRIATYFWYEPKLLFREYFGSSARTYFFSLLKNFALTILVTGCIYAFSRNIHPENWGILIIKSLIIGSICMTIYLLAYYRTEGAQNIVRKVKSIKFKSAK